MIFCKWSVKFCGGPPSPIGEQVKNKSREGWMLEGNRGPCWSPASWGHLGSECPKIISHIATRQMWRDVPLAVVVGVGVGGDNISFIQGRTAVCQTHRPFLFSVSSICKWYSADLNEATICAGLKRSFDIATPLIYCQLLIGTGPLLFVRPLSSVCCASRNPEAKTLPCVSAHDHKCNIHLSAVKEQLSAAKPVF